MAVNYKIVGGPGKWDLMLALFHGTTKEQHIVGIKYMVSNHEVEFPHRLIGVIREDGSGEGWFLKGFVAADTEHFDVRFKALYRTDTRRGWIEFEEEPRLLLRQKRA